MDCGVVGQKVKRVTGRTRILAIPGARASRPLCRGWEWEWEWEAGETPALPGNRTPISLMQPDWLTTPHSIMSQIDYSVREVGGTTQTAQVPLNSRGVPVFVRARLLTPFSAHPFFRSSRFLSSFYDKCRYSECPL